MIRPAVSAIVAAVVRAAATRGSTGPLTALTFDHFFQGAVPKEIVTRLGTDYFAAQIHVNQKFHVRPRTEAVMRWMR